MKRLINFPKIGQLRDAVHSVTHTATFAGMNDDGTPTYNKYVPLPKLTVTATEKLHGTNGGVCFNNQLGFWVQSRERIITPDDDNGGCAEYAYKNKDAWVNLMIDLAREYDIDLETHIVTVFFEWMNGGKRTALQGLKDKTAFIFKYFRVSEFAAPAENDKVDRNEWFETKIGDVWVHNTTLNIHNVNMFKTFDFEIDFANPLQVHNQIIEKVEEIEAASPIGKEFGFESNVGEGMVFSFKYKGKLFWFKAKGEKHSKSRVRTVVPVDDVKQQQLQELATKLTPDWRLEQMFNLANDTLNGGTPDVKNTGTFIRLVCKDIHAEEASTMTESGFTDKEITHAVMNVIRQWYNDELDSLILGEAA